MKKIRINRMPKRLEFKDENAWYCQVWQNTVEKTLYYPSERFMCLLYKMILVGNIV